MFRNTFTILIVAAALSGAACQSVGDANTNAVNKSTVTVTNPPPGFSGNVTNAAADPNAPKPTVMQKGATPIPGIPSEAELKKQLAPQTKKTPPIPGIPSEEELKRQMNTPVSNQKIQESKPPVAVSNSNVQSPTERPRRVVRKQ